MIVQSGGQLRQVAPAPFARYGGTSVTATGIVNGLTAITSQHGEVYAAQPNIRIPIDFLAGNVAQLGIHVFRRVSDTDRERLADHQLARWLTKPNPATTRYRLIEALLGDYGVYRNAFWLKVPYFNDEWNEEAIGLVRLPPDQVRPIGGLLPSGFVWTNPYDGRRKEFAPAEIVAFGCYNPLDPLVGLSHIDTLHAVVGEERAATQHRASYWANASRHEGVIERPREAPKWTDPQKQSFREQWQQRFAGAQGAGLVAVLEDGMQFKQTSFSPKDSEYIQGGKLRREVTAAEFNVPQPSIGILDHATFSNIREQHKQLYQDSLGPTLEMITQELERQLLIECDDQDNVYTEFNIAAKLAGSFEEQAMAIRTLVGRPVMTPNEARARLNLRAITNDPTADQLAPQQGGPADASVGGAAAEDAAAAADDTAIAPDDAAMVATVVQATRARQTAGLLKYATTERSTVFFAAIERWNRELADDLAPILGAAEAARVALRVNVEFFATLEAMEPV